MAAEEEKKGLIAEFKEFINRGNVMDLAIGIIIGGAFTAIVTALVETIINPLIAIITGGETPGAGLQLTVGAATIDFGAFIGAVINFLIVAWVVFMMVKALNKAQEAGKKLVGKDEEGEPEMDPPTCPFCLEEVKEGATRCPHCAGAFDKPAEPTPAQ